MIECHFQTWGREVAWQGCDPLRSLSLQPLRRTELDKNWKWMQPLCSFSRRWIFVWADQTGALCPRRSRTGGTTLVHFPEQKIFIQTNSLLYKESRLSKFPLATTWVFQMKESDKPHGFSWWGRRRSTQPSAAATPWSGQAQTGRYLHTHEDWG